jgi:hypothetical protein
MQASPAWVSDESEKNRRPGGSSVVGFPCRRLVRVYADGCSLGRTAKLVVLLNNNKWRRRAGRSHSLGVVVSWLGGC